MKDERISKEKKISLLRKACAQHQTLYKDAMNGKGIDRHLFGLYVLSEALGYVSRKTFHGFFVTVVCTDFTKAFDFLKL